MSLAEPRNAAYYSGYNADKVVKTIVGTYSSGDLITRVGDLATIYVHRIPHGFTRPVMCDLLTSTDGGTTYVGAVDKIAFSDSAYVYIFHGYATSGTPVDYKIYCSWIDEYDDTDPQIDVTSATSNIVQYDSRLNYQKIKEQGLLTFTPGTFGSSSTQTVAHGLTYAPNYRVYFEAFSGEVWPLNFGGVRNGLLYTSTQDEAEASTNTTNLSVTIYRYSNATRRAWYKIYYDAD